VCRAARRQDFRFIREKQCVLGRLWGCDRYIIKVLSFSARQNLQQMREGTHFLLPALQSS
jgi:hypothetical protein